MKLAVVQFAPTLGRPEETRERVRELSSEFAGADLVILPELANSGYAFATRAQAFSLAEDPTASPFVDQLVDICRTHQQHIITGLCERDGDELYNSALLLGPDGVIGTYRKLHLFLDEKDFFEPGNVGLPTFAIHGVRLGMLICFDWRFPEVWRGLALAGADLICHPSNLITPGLAQRVTPVHALLNHVYVATSNRVGREGSLAFTGASQVVDPSGKVVAQAGDTEEIVLKAEIDPSSSRDKAVNARNDLFADRRPDVYDS